MTTSRLNTGLLIRTGLGAMALAVAVGLLHGWQVRRHAQGQMLRADESEQVGDLDAAAAALGRYLRFAPGDREARSRYALLLARCARGPRERWQALLALRQAAAGQPGRPDVRQRLAELALGLNDPAEALRALEPALKADPASVALLELQAKALHASGQPLAAAEALERALAQAPDRVDLAVAAAGLRHAQLGQTARADAVLNRLVRDNPGRAGARLARARFHAALGRLTPASADLAEARRLAPRDLEVLDESARLAERRGALDEACRCWGDALAVAPERASVRVSLARAEQSRGRGGAAESVLREGLKRAPRQPDLLLAVAELGLAQGRVAECEALRDALPAGAASGRVAYLNGLLAERGGRSLEAANELVRASRLGDVTGEALARLMLALGRCYAALGAPDEQVRVVSYAAGLSAGNEARVELARVLLDCGRVDDALEVTRELASLPAPPPAAWPLHARALVNEQRGHPPERRNWAGVEAALGQAGPADAVAVALVRAEVQALRGDPAGARRVLLQATDDHPESVAAWRARCEMAAQLGEAAGAAAREEADGRLGERPEWLAARVALLERAVGARALRQLDAMEAAAARLEGAGRERVELALLAAQGRLRRFDAVERLAAARLRRLPGDLRARAALVESRLDRGDDRTAAELVGQMRKLELAEGAAWRCAQAAWALDRARRGDRAGLAEARRLVGEARQGRPAWSQPVVLEAQIDDAEGRPAEAVANYRRALALGDYRPAVLRRLVQILGGQKKYAELDAELQRAGRAAALGGELLGAAAVVALRAGRPDRAAYLARLAVPAGQGSSGDRAWLGRLLGRAGRETEAGEVLAEAVELAPGAADAWLALVEHHDRQGREGEVEAALRRMGRALHEDRRAAARARALESLGRFDEALGCYREAVAGRPFDADALRGQANLLMRLNDPAGAEAALARLLDPRAGLAAGDLPEVRRQLALAWTAPGRAPDRSEKALALLAGTRGAGGWDEADRRVAALVRGGRPAERAAAIRELEGLPAGPWAAPEERLRWAQVLAADGRWPRAREELLGLIRQDRKSPAYRVALIDGLLRNGKKAEAAERLAELERLAPRDGRVAELRTRLKAIEKARK